MDLNLTPEELAFREEVREFAEKSIPEDIKNKIFKHQRLDNTDYIRWHQILADKGWGAPTWPKEFGGTGWTAVQKLIFEIECFKAGAPRLLPFGLSMIGPVLMKYASPEMQQRFLSRIIRVEDWWCQGYSEPGAGSDLASLKTRAEKTAERLCGKWSKDMDNLGSVR
ncbi:isovaleryl-CoA dehydrogenase [Oligella ureolytica]